MKVIQSGKVVTEVNGEVIQQTSYEHAYIPNEPINEELYKTTLIYQLDIENSKPQDEVKTEIEIEECEEREEKLLQNDFLEKFVELEFESKRKLELVQELSQGENRDLQNENRNLRNENRNLQDENTHFKNECTELKKQFTEKYEEYKTEIIRIKKENERLKYKFDKQQDSLLKGSLLEE